MNTINKKSVIRYAVPFYFDNRCGAPANDSYKDLCQSLDGSPVWLPDSMPREERDTFDYICRSVLSEADDTGIGRSWNYDFKNKRLMFRYNSGKAGADCQYWQIERAGIYAFRTNIGFIWYEIVQSKNQTVPVEADEFASFQNRFKELCRRDTCFELFIPKTSKDGEDTYEPFSPGKWICGLLRPLSDGIRFMNAVVSGNEEMPDKALIFNYVLFDGDAMPEDQLRKMACLLANGYTGKYRIHHTVLNDVLEPFEDTCWYASRGGCGYFTCVNEDNNVFRNGLETRIRSDYFFIYILALYQSYSLLNYLRRMTTEHSADPEKYLKLSEEGDSLGRFVAELNTFLMKGMYTSVSSVQHQNDFFEYLQKRLYIRDDVESINMGIDALVNLQRLQKDEEDSRKKAEEEKRSAARENQLNFSLAIISVFSVFSALLDLGALISQFKGFLGSGASLFSTDTLNKLWQFIQAGLPWTALQILMYIVIGWMSVYCVLTLVRNSVKNKKIKKK